MKCIMSGCAADSIETDESAMNCGGKGATTTPEGLWCVAGWLKSWSDQYPDYADFLVARPWAPKNR